MKFITQVVATALVLAFWALQSPVHAAEHVVVQRGRAFVPDALKIKVGDTVRFVNEDGLAHNVASFSGAKTFDLGTFPKGTAKSVVFETEGVVDVICGIHKSMKLLIEVQK